MYTYIICQHYQLCKSHVHELSYVIVLKKLVISPFHIHLDRLCDNFLIQGNFVTCCYLTLQKCENLFSKKKLDWKWYRHNFNLEINWVCGQIYNKIAKVLIFTRLSHLMTPPVTFPSFEKKTYITNLTTTSSIQQQIEKWYNLCNMMLPARQTISWHPSKSNLNEEQGMIMTLTLLLW